SRIAAQVFAPPTFFEALYTSPYQIPNPAIQSEYVRGGEASFEQRVGRNNFLVGVFRTRWRDMSSIQTLESGVSQYQNVAAVDNFGINASAQGAFDSLRYGASLVAAHTHREAPEGEEPLPVAPQFFGN